MIKPCINCPNYVPIPSDYCMKLICDKYNIFSRNMNLHIKIQNSIGDSWETAKLIEIESEKQ